MADEFQSEICSSGWWSSSTKGHMGKSSSCSSALNEVGGYGWSPVVTEAARTWEGSPLLTANSICYQRIEDPVHAPTAALLDPNLQMAGFPFPSPSLDWSQVLLRGSGRAESNFQSMLQEDFRSVFRQEDPSQQPQVHREWSVENYSPVEDGSTAPVKQITRALSLDREPPSFRSSELMASTHGLQPSDFSLLPSSYEGQPSLLQLQGFYDPNHQLPQAYAESRSRSSSSELNYFIVSGDSSSTICPSLPLPQFFKSPASTQAAQQLQFSPTVNPFWNAATGVKTVTPAFFQDSRENLEQPQPISCNLTHKPGPDEHDSPSPATKTAGDPAFKKPRTETTTSFPAFKVRKEKLGDRITALQQLVSPFGKTDTASVLFETIEYIKFLHEQVTVLSTPYMKSAAPMQQNSDKSNEREGPARDLRNRGLCLVPISRTFPVTNDAASDFWTPTYGGTYR